MSNKNDRRSENAFVYEIVDGPKLLVAGLSVRTTNVADGVIGSLWQRFTNGEVPADGLSLHESHEVLAAYTDYQSDEHGAYTYTLGFRVTTLDHLPAGLSGAEIPAQTFARIAVEGDPAAAIPATWEQIWTAFTDEPYERQFVADVEVYAEDPATGEKTAAIMVGVAPR